jgi:hypothetical protein
VLPGPEGNQVIEVLIRWLYSAERCLPSELVKRLRSLISKLEGSLRISISLKNGTLVKGCSCFFRFKGRSITKYSQGFVNMRPYLHQYMRGTIGEHDDLLCLILLPETETMLCEPHVHVTCAMVILSDRRLELPQGPLMVSEAFI